MPKTFNADSVRDYLKEIGRIPLLQPHEEIEVATKIQAGIKLLESVQKGELSEDTLTDAERSKIAQTRAAKQRLIKANLRLVVSIAKEFDVNTCSDLMDFVQEGSIGLNRAAELFDPTKGYKFSTYAYHWIRQGITRCRHNQSRVIRVPVHMQEDMNKLRKLVREFMQTKGRYPNQAEMTELSGFGLEKISILIKNAESVNSLDRKLGSDNDDSHRSLLDVQVSRLPTPEDIAIRSDQRKFVCQFISRLTPRERSIVDLRFGLSTGEVLSLAEIGTIHDLSRERIRQIEAKAMRKLRIAANKKKHRNIKSDLLAV